MGESITRSLFSLLLLRSLLTQNREHIPPSQGHLGRGGEGGRRKHLENRTRLLPSDSTFPPSLPVFSPSVPSFVLRFQLLSPSLTLYFTSVSVMKDAGDSLVTEPTRFTRTTSLGPGLIPTSGSDPEITSPGSGSYGADY